MEINRKSMTEWIVEALRELGGSGSVLEICKAVWENHGEEIAHAGDMFYKWQYEIRWAGHSLEKEGSSSHQASPAGKWHLK